MRVLVTDGDNRAALAVTRSLGRAGHDVLVGERSIPSLAQSSRYCSVALQYPDPAIDPDRFVDVVSATAAEQRIDVLVPVADITTLLVTGNRDRFPRSCAIPFAGGDVVRRAANKVDILQTAMRLGIPVPRTVIVCDPARVPQHDLSFPVFIKPRQSRIPTDRGWVSSSVSYAESAEALARDLAARPRHEFPVMLQERIVGPGMGVFAYYRDGRPLALFSHRRVRERPPWGGVSVLSESTAVCPQAGEYATRLLEEIGWEGVAMVEFKRDERDGTPKLMEINGRFWGSLQLAIDAGVDFPALLVEGVTRTPAPQAPYRVGVRNRWLWGDIDSLFITMSGRRGPDGANVPSRRQAVADFSRVYGKDLFYDNPKPGDLGPWVYETKRRLQSVVSGSSAQAQAPRAMNGRPAAAPPAGALRARVAGSLEELGVDADEWNGLAGESATNTIFQSYQWHRAWLNTYGRAHQRVLMAVNDGRTLKGLAAFILEHRLAGERTLKFVGDGRSDYCDVLGGPDAAPVLHAVLRQLNTDSRWDAIELNNLQERSETVAILTSLCARLGYPTLVDKMYPCPTLLVTGHEDEVRELMNRPSIRRKVNSFTRDGRLVCSDLSTAREIEEWLEPFFNQHVARWGGGHTSSLFATEQNRAFYRELTRELSPTGWLLFSIVQFNDHPVAFHYGFDYNGSVIWYKPSFDLAFERQSPGIVLVRHLIAYALDRGRRELDFTVGDEPFKRRFTNAVRHTVRVHIFRDSARYLMERSRRQLAKAVKRLSG